MSFRELIKEIDKLGVDRNYHFVLHRSRYHYPAISEYDLSAHSALYDRLFHTRDHSVGVFFHGYVSHSGR